MKPFLLTLANGNGSKHPLSKAKTTIKRPTPRAPNYYVLDRDGLKERFEQNLDKFVASAALPDTAWRAQQNEGNDVHTWFGVWLSVLGPSGTMSNQGDDSDLDCWVFLWSVMLKYGLVGV